MLKLKCTKFDFSWGSAPDPDGELKAPPDPLAGYKGPTSKEREGKTDGREGQNLFLQTKLRPWQPTADVLTELETSGALCALATREMSAAATRRPPAIIS